jgi:hypothetical protein
VRIKNSTIACSSRKLFRLYSKKKKKKKKKKQQQQ